MRAGVWVNDDDGHLFLIADLVHTPQSWTGRQLATGCIITIMSCFQFIVSVIVTVARWTVMSCSLPGVGSLLLSQNKTPTDSLATGPWAPPHILTRVSSVWVWVWHCHWLIWANTGHSGSHLSLIQTERENIGAGCPNILLSIYFGKTNRFRWIYFILFSLFTRRSKIPVSRTWPRTNKLLRQLTLNSLW